jgi:hypothetical protein
VEIPRPLGGFIAIDFADPNKDVSRALIEFCRLKHLANGLNIVFSPLRLVIGTILAAIVLTVGFIVLVFVVEVVLLVEIAVVVVDIAAEMVFRQHGF